MITILFLFMARAIFLQATDTAYYPGMSLFLHISESGFISDMIYIKQ